jgi:transcription elongation factor GreA
VFVVELPAPLPTAPIELTRVGKWLERVPALTLDGLHPSSRALSARLAAFWLPSEVVLYVGATTSSIGARVRAMADTTLGDRRPHAGGHWLHTLRVLPTTRLWWAATDAVEEYEDALLAAFADSVEPSQTGPQAAIARDVAAPGAVILPFANLRRPTGERRATGLIGALRPEPVEPVPPPTRVVVVPDGDADGARGEPPPPRRRSAPPRSRPGGAPISLTAEGAQRLRDQLAELSGARRTEVVGRIRAAKELGDLKENADYTAAREEQSFLEGRIQAIEARLREAVIAPEPSAGGPGGAQFGSTITVDTDGQETVYRLVGSAEADPGAGRLSIESPVGRALLGAVPGATVRVQTPRGPVDYRVIALD